MNQKLIQMTNNNKQKNHICIIEKQVNQLQVDVAELKTRIDYKHQRIDELKQSIDEIDKKIDKIDHCLSKLKMQSKSDDFNIDSRVTKLENTQNVLKWITGIGLTIVTTAVAVMGFLLTIMH